MNHPHVVADEPPQTREVEVERVVETCGRLPGDAVRLDREPTPLQLADQGQQELVAASVRRRVKLVEDSDVCAAAARRAEVTFGSRASRETAPETAERVNRRFRLHRGRNRHRPSEQNRVGP
jgi:hypothetical protein